jgi:hypothetical protein
MEVLEYIKKAEGGKIVIEVPEQLDGKELLVLVREKIEFDVKNEFDKMSSQERLAYVMQFCGTAKYPDYPVDKYDVYDQ